MLLNINLIDYIIKKLDNSLFHINQSYWEMGEKPGRLLTYRLKQQNSRNHIAGIRLQKCTISTSSKQINEEFRGFYKTLSISQSILDNQKFDSFFADLHSPQLKIRIDDFYAPLKVEEISHVINNTPSNKSPGLDGLPSDFYTKCETSITPILIVM